MASFKVDPNLIDPDVFGQENNSVNTTPSTPEASTSTIPQVDANDQFQNDPIIRTIGSGVEKFARGVHETGRGILDFFGVDTPELPQETRYTPQGKVEEIASTLVEYGIGTVAGVGALKGVKVAEKIGKAATIAGGGSIGVFLSADPNAQRLSNIIEQTPELSNKLTEILQQDPSDSKLTSKSKAAVEDVLTTLLGVGLAKAAAPVLQKSLQIAKLRSAGKTAEADVLAKELSTDVDKLEKLKNGKGVWDTTKLPDDHDAVKSVAGAQVAAKITKSKVTDLIHTRTPEEMITPEYRAKVDTFKKELQDNPSNVPAIMQEELPNGTLRSQGDARLLAAKELGLDEVPVVNYRTAETSAAKDAASVQLAAPSSGKVVFKLTPEESTKLSEQIADAIELNKLDDVFDSKEFRAFNHSKLDVSADTIDTVEALTKYIAPQLKLSQIQKHEQVKEAAKVFGMKEADLEARLLHTYKGTQDLAATIVAAKGYALSLSRDISNLTKMVKNGVATDADKEALETLIQKATNVAGMTRGIIRESARGTSAGNIKIDDEFLNGLSLLNPDEIPQALAKKSLGRQAADTAITWWLSSIMSGVATHARNFLGSALQTPKRRIDMAVGGALTGDWRTVREAGNEVLGLVTGQQNALRVAARSWKQNRAILDPGHSSDDVVIQNLGGPEQAAAVLAKYPLAFMNGFANLTFRTLKATDEYWKQLNYGSSLAVIAKRSADKLIDEKTLDPKKMVDVVVDGKTIQRSEVDVWMDDFIKKGYDTTGAATDSEALRIAREATFTSPLESKASKALQGVTNEYPGLKVLFPFITVPGNIIKSSFDLTPALLLQRKKFWAELTSGDPLKRSLATGKAATASMFTGAVWYAASEGMLTGGGPNDFALRKRMMESGWQPYSVRLVNEDGTYRYIALTNLGPFSVSIMTLLEVMELYQNADEQDLPEVASLAGHSLLSIVNGLSDQSYFASVFGVMDAIHSENPLEGAQKWGRNFAGSQIPNITKTFNPDTEMKEIRSLSDALKTKIPGLSQDVEAKRNYFGEKIYHPLSYPWNAISPSKISSEGDAADLEIARLSSVPGGSGFINPTKKFPGTDLDLTELRNEKGQSAYDRWMELKGEITIGGKTFREAVNHVIKTESYKKGTDGDKTNKVGSRDEDVRKLSKRYLDKARDQMVREFELNKTVRDKKQTKKDMKKGVVRDQPTPSSSREEDQINELIEFGQ